MVTTLIDELGPKIDVDDGFFISDKTTYGLFTTPKREVMVTSTHGRTELGVLEEYGAGIGSVKARLVFRPFSQTPYGVLSPVIGWFMAHGVEIGDPA